MSCHCVKIVLLAAAILFVRMHSSHAAPLGVPSPQPSDKAEVKEKTVHVPQVLMDIYECWNNGGEHCLNLPVSNDEVNIVRSLIGHCE